MLRSSASSKIFHAHYKGRVDCHTQKVKVRSCVLPIAGANFSIFVEDNTSLFHIQATKMEHHLHLRRFEGRISGDIGTDICARTIRKVTPTTNAKVQSASERARLPHCWLILCYRSIPGYLILVLLDQPASNLVSHWITSIYLPGDRYCYALVNLIPHYTPPGPTRAFDKVIDERPFSQGGAFDTAPFNVCWFKSGLWMIWFHRSVLLSTVESQKVRDLIRDSAQG